MALVTGAASGVGRGLATLLRARGYRLWLVDIDRAALEGVAAELAAEDAVAVDVADAPAMQELADAVGAVDLLCLNAGVVSTSTGPPWGASPDEWQRVFGVNVFGVVNGLRAFVPRLLDRATPRHILITASLAGAATWPGGGPYAASKHAVLAVAEQAALELADTNVTVTVLCPALVRTGMSDVGDDPLDVAAEALQAVEDGRFAVVPDEWTPAIEQRSVCLTSGRQPELPTPTGT